MKNPARIRRKKEHPTDQQNIVLYAEVYAVTQQMFENAQRGDWHSLTSQETGRQNILKRVRTPGKNQRMDKEAAERQAELIRKTLSIDNQIKTLVVQKMRGLRQDLDLGKKIVQAYGPHT